MNIIIACETSAEVRSRMELKGHNVWSCDLKNSAKFGNHYKGSIFDILDTPERIGVSHWDMMIAFPPCTHLAISGGAWFDQKRKDGRQQQGIDFFMAMVNANIPKIAIENPVGIMSSIYRQPDQIIQPYYFGDPSRKPTCIWLKNLPKLVWIAKDDLFSMKTTVEPEIVELTSKKTGKKRTYSAHEYAASTDHNNRAGIRSKTFSGIAQAMADQWT